MFSHVMVGANDLQQSKKFYDAILGVLGHSEGVVNEKGQCFYKSKTGGFGFSLPLDKQPATPANGGTIGFSAASREAVNAWHEAGIKNGGTTCEDPPGLRPSGLYLAYLRDPAGNKLCAVHR